MITIHEVTQKYLPKHTDRHMDLGCGSNPRNPFKKPHLYGCDITDFRTVNHHTHQFIQSDLSKGNITADDDFFDSVSAFDFLEHVPRQEKDRDGNTTFPFINLMDEIHRILVPHGIFISSTPAFPSPLAFQDPTHVNIISANTHKYFCAGDRYASRYGFRGQFKCIYSNWNSAKNLENPDESKIRKIYRNFEYRFFKSGLSHITWILQAIK